MNVVIGQGIAGTVLALKMLKVGLEVTVLDDGHQSSSSTVAAGMWNPIVFRKINKSWRADDFIASLQEFYPEMEQLLGATFFNPITIWRIHSSPEEKRYWNEKKEATEFAPYLGQTGIPSEFEQMNFAHGQGDVYHAGSIDVPVFLEAAKSYFKNLGIYRNATVTLSDYHPEDELLPDFEGKFVRYFDCRGYKSAFDGPFTYLPYGLTKGEVLTIRCPDLNLKKVFNAGFFLLPLGDDLYRLGATFDWKNIDAVPTNTAKDELLSKFEKWFDVPYRVVDHLAGIRPTVVDRRPLIGSHPAFAKWHIFNGLGTKGIMMAPLMADEFLSHLSKGSKLDPEADIQRFVSHWK